MSTIAQLVADIHSAPAPVIFIDTCSILDVARAPARDRASSVEAAEAVVRLAGTSPPGVYLLTADIVNAEWADHIQSAKDDTERAVNTCSAVAAVHTFIRGGPAVSLPLDLNLLSQELEARAKHLLTACQPVDRDFAAMNAALTRVVQKKKPSSKNQIKDCHILEHCLAVVRGLRQQGFTRPFFFVSSNVEDFFATARHR
ncbi:MAG: hypothetical protein K2P78_10625 [Gemmataceae bacterium]|nr:hypothetical protein [Gemmataceae bacterium]